MKTRHPTSALSRRDFLQRTALGAAAVFASSGRALAAGEPPGSPVVVFSKIYQELKLGYGEAAALTAEAQLDGIDCPVRPGGEIEPEKAPEELPRYVETLRKQHLIMPLITTGILGTATPHTEPLLRTARRLGVQYYRLGTQPHDKAVPLQKQLGETRARLKDLAALNGQIGIGAIFQNHSPTSRKFIGGDLTELREIVAGFNPAEIGVAFDIGHALVVHGDGWREHFEQLRPYVRVVYVKDVTRAGRWLALGKGDIHQTGYFNLLRQIRFSGPVSLHVEYDWDHKGESRNRPTLLEALKQDQATLRTWLRTG